MTLQLRVKLTTGDTHRLAIGDDDDPDNVARRFKSAEAPFDDEWLTTADGELIRKSAIVWAAVEPAPLRHGSFAG